MQQVDSESLFTATMKSSDDATWGAYRDIIACSKWRKTSPISQMLMGIVGGAPKAYSH